MSGPGDRSSPVETPDSGSVAAAAFDALPAQVAVVDADGVIVETNRAWREFGVDNDLRGDPGMVGVNYLAVCEAGEAAGDGTATSAAAGIRSVLDGERESFSLEYPCHSPDEHRWFIMRTIPLDGFDEPHALVMHTDITERKAAEHRVGAHNEMLEAVTNVLSHDLRNPLNVVLGGADLLARNPDTDPASVAESAERIVSSAERMDTIIDDALLLGRGAPAVDLERVALGDAAADAWSHVATGDATLSVAGTATLEADASLLSQLLENLFRNAVEHAGDDVTVTVTATDDGFVVADDGPGIPADERERVFDAGVTGGSGTGMGLAIVERIADAHGWDVRATGPDAAEVATGPDTGDDATGPEAEDDAAGSPTGADGARFVFEGADVT